MAGQSTLLKAISTIGGFTMISRVLGFVRDILIASFLGAGMVADVFFVAFKLPNFFRRLFAEGAFNAGFVPLFSRIHQTDGDRSAREFAEQALSVLLLTLFILVTVFQIFMPLVMTILAPGFQGDVAKFDLAVDLTRLTFPYLMFISLVSLMGGVLNSLGRFAAVAATPILLNICLISALLVFAQHLPTPGHALAWGVAAAGAVQFVWLLLALRKEGWHLKLRPPRLTPRVIELLKLMAPAAVGAGIVQINLVIDIILASLLPEGSISYLFYADRLNQLPIGVVGVAVGTALLPMLSRRIAAGDDAGAAHALNRATEFSLLLALPAALALVVIAEPLISVLFERGAFDAQASRATSFALMAYAFGLPAYVLVKVLTPGFFARLDTRTPVRIALIALAVNLVLNIALMIPLQHAGLALATAISAWVNVWLLYSTLRRRGHFPVDARLAHRLRKTVVAATIMGAGLFFGHRQLLDWLAGDTSTRIAALAILVLGGGILYGLAVQISGAARLGELKSQLRGNGDSGTA
ncbi:MAG: murein biosynthesis integral membrane protein MurJ [Alphaproteobacteria bacterium]|nr:murein biosynthesis integral membrane protein MurJ [Alphaproteobacteria bacterium]